MCVFSRWFGPFGYIETKLFSMIETIQWKTILYVCMSRIHTYIYLPMYVLTL